MLNKYKYILFDLDGTLTDPKVGITKSFQYALKSFDIEVNDLDSLCSFIGPPLKEPFMKCYGFDESQTDMAIKKFREYFSDKGIFENEIYKGIPELLSELKDNGKTLILATSKLNAFAERILEHFNIRQYFDYVSGSTFDGKRIEKGDIIKHAIEKNQILNLSEAVMVGDREHDIIGAKQAGIASIGVLYGYGSYEELNNAGADKIVSSVNELLEILI